MGSWGKLSAFQSIDLIHLQVTGKCCLSNSKMNKVTSVTHWVNAGIVHLAEKAEKMIDCRAEWKQHLFAINAF